MYLIKHGDVGQCRRVNRKALAPLIEEERPTCRTFTEIATLLGVTKQNVAITHDRALKKIAAGLRGETLVGTRPNRMPRKSRA